MSYKNTELFWHTENMCLLNKHFTSIPYTVAKTSTGNSFLKDLLVKVYDLYFNDKRERKILENYIYIPFMLTIFLSNISLLVKGRIYDLLEYLFSKNATCYSPFSAVIETQDSFKMNNHWTVVLV